METEKSEHSEYTKIIERLFIFVDTRNIDMNRQLNLAVNPEIIKILVQQLQTATP